MSEPKFTLVADYDELKEIGTIERRFDDVDSAEAWRKAIRRQARVEHVRIETYRFKAGPPFLACASLRELSEGQERALLRDAIDKMDRFYGGRDG